MDAPARRALMSHLQRHRPPVPDPPERAQHQHQHHSTLQQPTPVKRKSSLPQPQPPPYAMAEPSLPPANELSFADAAKSIAPSISAPDLLSLRPAALLWANPQPKPAVPLKPSLPPRRPTQPLPSLVESAQVSDASRDVSYLTDQSSWRVKAAAAAADGSALLGGSSHLVPPIGRSGGGVVLSSRHELLTDEPSDVSEPHRWYIRAFEKPLPAGRRDAVQVSRWLDHLDALDAAAEEEAEAAGSGDRDGGHDGGLTGRSGPPMSRERVEQYSAAFEELVKQVSVGCIERGQVLTRVWQRLAGSMTGFIEVEDALRSEQRTLSKQLSREVDRVRRLANERGELLDRIKSIEQSQRWSTAAIRIRRYHDTVRWRAALMMLSREKTKLVRQLEELRKVNAAAAAQILIASSDEGEDDEPHLQTPSVPSLRRGPPPPPPEPAATLEVELPLSPARTRATCALVDEKIQTSLRQLPLGDGEEMEEGVKSIAEQVAPNLQTVGLASVAASSLTVAQRRKVARRQAEERVVDGILRTALNELEDEMTMSRKDLASASREAKEVAQMAADLKEKNELLAGLRAQLRSSRDEVDSLQRKLAEQESGRVAAEKAKRSAEQEAAEARQLAEAAVAREEAAAKKRKLKSPKPDLPVKS